MGGGYGSTGATISSAGALSINGAFISDAGSISVGTTTASTEIAAASSATTTVYVTSTSSTKGGCIQLEGANGTVYRLYIGGAGTLVTEAGVCK